MNFFKSLFSKPDPNIDESKILLSILKLTKSTNQQTQLKPGDSAALLLSPNDDTFFSKFNESTKSIIKNSQAYAHIHYQTHSDPHGTMWIILRCGQFETLVSTIDYVSSAIASKGLGERMIAAIFKGSYDGHNSYWICNYRTSRFYPFIPKGDKIRSQDDEIKLGDIFRKKGLRVEPPENWFAIWEAPF